MAPIRPDKLDCKRTYKMIAESVHASASILDKIKVEIALDPQKIVVLNAWTSWALARVFTECDLFKRTGDDHGRQRYEAELDKLDDWVSDIAEVLGKYGALLAATTGPAQPPTDDKTKQSAKAEIESTIDKHVTSDEKKLHPTGLKPAVDETQSVTSLLAELQKRPAKTPLEFA